MDEISKTELGELGSWIKDAVTEALKGQPTELECPDCHTKMDTIPKYIDHRVTEYLDKTIEPLKTQVEAVKVPTSEEILEGCKDGFCKIIEDTYDVRKKGEAPQEEPVVGLFDHHKDEPEAPE